MAGDFLSMVVSSRQVGHFYTSCLNGNTPNEQANKCLDDDWPVPGWDCQSPGVY